MFSNRHYTECRHGPLLIFVHRLMRSVFGHPFIYFRQYAGSSLLIDYSLPFFMPNCLYAYHHVFVVLEYSLLMEVSLFRSDHLLAVSRLWKIRHWGTEPILFLSTIAFLGTSE